MCIILQSWEQLGSVVMVLGSQPTNCEFDSHLALAVVTLSKSLYPPPPDEFSVAPVVMESCWQPDSEETYLANISTGCSSPTQGGLEHPVETLARKVSSLSSCQRTLSNFPSLYTHCSSIPSCKVGTWLQGKRAKTSVRLTVLNNLVGFQVGLWVPTPHQR